MNSVISARNAKLLAPNEDTVKKTCSCPGNKSCPLGAKCLEKGIIYKATVKQENNKINTYIGLTCNSFKKRFYSHNASFKNPDLNQTTLSNFVRNLQDKKNQAHNKLGKS